MKPYKLEASLNLLLPGFPDCCWFCCGNFLMPHFHFQLDTLPRPREQLLQNGGCGLARPTRERGHLSGPARPSPSLLPGPLRPAQ